MEVLARRVLPICCPRGYGRDLLPDLFYELGYHTGAEIGVRVGRYSAKLCEANSSLTLYSIDPWKAYSDRYPQDRQDRIYQEAIKRLTPYNAKILRKESMEALGDFEDGYFDFVFIDGNHLFDYVAPDIIFWSRKVRSGGMVCVHDFYHGETGVVMAVEAYTYSNDIRPWYTTKELQPTAFWVKP